MQLIKFAGITAVFLAAVSCSGGGGGGGGGGEGESGPSARKKGGLSTADFACTGACANVNLSAGEVDLVLRNAVLGAQTLGVAATFAVTDRVGNVLVVYQMDGATTTTTVNGQIGAVGGLEGLTVPASLAAISKAGTGAYLSSQGNAFSTRTASQIVQEHFNPGERNQPGGPLFGVQFSQLLCGDVTVRNSDVKGGLRTGSSKFEFGGSIGPRPLPLGLSADPGGIPLYKNGDLVGGVGVELDGAYRLDRNILDFDDDPEERIALIASRGFEAPGDRVAPNISVGKFLRYTDLGYEDLGELPTEIPTLDGSNFLVIPEFTNGRIRDGAVFGDVSSGYMKTVRAGAPAAILVSPSGAARYPTRGGTSLSGGVQLAAVEVDALLDSALLTAFRGRAAIRRPFDTPIRVSIWVVDTNGEVLGFVRSEDAPVFGTDVALQKARTAAFFSSSDAGDRLSAAGFSEYVTATKAFIGPDALTGVSAFSDRAVGNFARPFFTDGIDINPNGPFALPFPGTPPLTGTGLAGQSWSPFNTGLQLDVAFGNLAASLGLVGASEFPDSCANEAVFGRRLANGIQIFAGAVPLYRGTTLIGAIGISGDGIDQDDMVAFYGSSRKGLDFAGHLGIGDPILGFNAPVEIRVDTVNLPGRNSRVRYVNCPEGPFSGSNEQNVCDKI